MAYFLGFLLVLFIVYVIAGVLLFFMEFSIEYGLKFLKDEDILRSLQTNIPLGVHATSDGLIIGNMPPIVNTRFTIYFVKFNVEGLGSIPIWYKSHKYINKMYKIERKKYKASKKANDIAYTKRRLGIN